MLREPPAVTVAPPPVERPSQRGARLDQRAIATTMAVAAVVFLVAYEQGGYSVQNRSIIAILVWWAVIGAIVIGLWPFAALGVEAAAAALALAALAALTLASTVWASSGERVFEEFNRVTMYTGVLLLALVAARRARAAQWADGIAIGITATALLALISRCFPQLIDTTSSFRFLPPGRTRLNYPIGYWNGLAVFTALGLPLLFRAALAARPSVLRALALAPIPALVTVMYLTSSRTGAIAAGAGIFTLFVLHRRRFALSGAIVVAAAGAAAAVAVVAARQTLVNGPLGTRAAEHEGWTAAVLILAACGATAVAYVVLVAATRRRQKPSVGAERVLLASVAVLVIAGAVAIHPLRTFDRFRAPLPPGAASTDPNYVRNHFFSVSGNGRWELWTAAARQFNAHPVLGGGAGSYQEWWTQHRPALLFVRDAHSLYVEVLAELGVPGLLLVLTFLGSGIAAGGRRLVRARGEERTVIAAVLASLAAFAVAASGDWMWELTVVGVLGVVFVGLLVGPATAKTRERVPPWGALAAVVGVAAVALAVIGSQAVQLYTDVKLQRSQAAFARGDGRAALHDASDARGVEPWASTPYLQLALVSEQYGDLSTARTWIEKATARDPDNWSLWLVRARLETKAAAIPEARRSLARARELNPLGVPRASS
jgi:O-antigen ligase